jgi:hypothetical protein
MCCALQAPLAQAVLDKVQPSSHELRTQGTGKAVMSALRNDAQKQAARSGQDQEAAAAAAAKGKRNGRSSTAAKKQQTAPTQQRKQTSRLRQRTVIPDDASSDEADAELLDDTDGSGDEADVSNRAGKRARKAPVWQAEFVN